MRATWAWKNCCGPKCMKTYSLETPCGYLIFCHLTLKHCLRIWGSRDESAEKRSEQSSSIRENLETGIKPCGYKRITLRLRACNRCCPPEHRRRTYDWMEAYWMTIHVVLVRLEFYRIGVGEEKNKQTRLLYQYSFRPLLTSSCRPRTRISLHDARCVTHIQTFPKGGTTSVEGNASWRFNAFAGKAR